MTALDELKRIEHRWRFYNEPPSLESIAEIAVDLESDLDSIHSDCRHVDEPCYECQEKQDLIEDLEAEIANLKAQVEAKTTRRGRNPKAQTPSDARSTFKLIEGGQNGSCF